MSLFDHNKPSGKSASASQPTVPGAGGSDSELDARGLNCPLPILRAKKALNDLTAGQILRVVATDPGSIKDFEAFAKQTGNELIESGEEGGEFIFKIKKTG
ncbi:MAG: hypothetical protein BMS9Abin33_0860 [Gammaproteobacteria bacterium]|nr:MAG: hypothetical protein BMS9Abin33_0860 [Gammaproteobacteria bacterium]